MDINVKVIDMDTKIPEQVIKNADESYTIFLNAKLSYERQLESYYHAMKHIERGDFSRYDVQEIEFTVRANCTDESKPIPAKQYLEELFRLQKEHKVLQRKIQQDEERIRFLQESFNMYERAENSFLYSFDM